MTEQEFEQFVQLGHETPGVEFKSPGLRTDKNFLAGVARAVLAMANRRGGGLVIIGVRDDGSQLQCRHRGCDGGLDDYDW